MSDFLKVLNERTSTEHFESETSISVQEIKELHGMYGSDPRLSRDEAIRSGSLAAMTLMLATEDRGYVCRRFQG
jgi:hypothetical protein